MSSSALRFALRYEMGIRFAVRYETGIRFRYICPFQVWRCPFRNGYWSGVGAAAASLVSPPGAAMAAQLGCQIPAAAMLGLLQGGPPTGGGAGAVLLGAAEAGLQQAVAKGVPPAPAAGMEGAGGELCCEIIGFIIRGSLPYLFSFYFKTTHYINHCIVNQLNP